ncbi:hypothetical protein [Pseudomonas aeruginosa]|uniref:hypothetical protein n=1 Tax=Pseudomonas aeruginosa group TaxID=136841 RepID=UPI0011C1AFDF|nr:hypothetical protein [Pseudomonas aeruginosa]EIU3709799.1 hypothetical protein [Pseudomonas aeruginosa]EIU3903982.1 hypothetical protein [Pseudomonas aeruginosa]EKV3211803.1 hypothetical protein [Pseudomonas aeruginosa]MDE8656670.1 hypothetical protein [Pseudomonas aeruginosa]MDE8664403.1 hypothetical protein [Pseudomonas aeruginosa]
MKLAGILKEAFEKAGVPLPETPKKKAVPVLDQRKKKVTRPDANQERKVRPKTARKKDSQVAKSAPAQNGKKVTVTANGTCITRWSGPEPVAKGATSKAVAQSCGSEGAKGGSTESLRSDPDYSITATAEACVTWHTLQHGQSASLMEWPQGYETQLNNSTDEKFLCLGLDFGSSTLKAVISDGERQITYAVPFRDIQGIEGYLLPCRVYLGENGYSLEGQGQVYQDLKLALLANAESLQAQLPAVGFLALALRMIRGWLLSTHGETYSGAIIWDLAIGLPVASRRDERTVRLYQLVSTAAWIASTERQLTPEAIGQALKRAEALCSGAEAECDSEDIEVRVEPEIAAQIYGFVSSGAYDPYASNIYLMVDVGAGTLDASVFRVERKRGQRKDSLVIFRTTVEPHGVMNFHKKRMDWLQSALAQKLPERPDLRKAVQAISHLTDAEEALPDRVDGYFSGVDVQFKGRNLDQLFYAQVNRQVVQDTYVHVANESLLDRQQMAGIPMFLCGGGSRSGFYAKLKSDLHSARGFSWFGVTPKPLQKPRGLVAPGLRRADYDRLSVAFGLSQLKLDKLVMDVPALAEKAKRVDFSERYIEK